MPIFGVHVIGCQFGSKIMLLLVDFACCVMIDCYFYSFSYDKEGGQLKHSKARALLFSISVITVFHFRFILVTVSVACQAL